MNTTQTKTSLLSVNKKLTEMTDLPEKIVVAVQVLAKDAGAVKAHDLLRSSEAQEVAKRFAIDNGIESPRFDDHAPIVPFDDKDKACVESGKIAVAFICFYNIGRRIV